MDDLHYFLGIEVTRLADGSLHFYQRKYIFDMLERCHMLNVKGVNTPMVVSTYLMKTLGAPLADLIHFRRLSGTLQYVVLTRPDIAYAVNQIC